MQIRALVEELFYRVADLEPAIRTQYFVDHEIDDDTRREVEALLEFDSGASAFLARGIGMAARRALPQIEAAVRYCGPYRLLRVIGRGGMGAVYLAERADGEVAQRVAIKLLPPGMGDQHRERFLHERQILATIDHPNVARLIDAGQIAGGQPFLAMEYVEGQTIDLFAAEMRPRATIALFLKVCAAVAYLHRHLIVHRDLKPANILVTSDGEPKLLDFGIAKLLDLTSDTTVTSVRMLTPLYASPEQITGGKLSTATDIYSLGALLYRLLTGRTPHDLPGHSAGAVASAVVAHGVPRPSQWVPELKGDLDSVLLKALRRDPGDRYATVESFADDLEAFLQSRPVRARWGDAGYRTRKFLRRHWVPATATVMVIASLASGLYVANRERAVAQRRFDDVRQLANRLFDVDAEVRRLPGSTKARQLIVDTSLDYLRRLAADVHGDPELALEVANAYTAAARVEGVTMGGPNLGQLDEAERDLRIADGLVESVLRRQPANRAALLSAAQIARDRMVVAWEASRNDEALAFAQQAAAWLEKFQVRTSDQRQAGAVLNAYVHVAHQYMMSERFDEALEMSRRGSDLAIRLDRPYDRIGFLDTTALSLRYRGDLDGALAAARESVRLQDPVAGELSFPAAMNFVLALAREGWILGEAEAISFGRSDEALAVLQRAFTLADGFVHKDPKDESTRSRLFLAGGPMADILRRSDAGRALAIYDHTLADMETVHSKFLQLRAVQVLAGSSYALRRLGRTADARQRLDRAFASLKELKLYPADKIEPGSEADIALRALADHEADAGHVAAAIDLYQDLLNRMSAGTPAESSLTVAARHSYLYQSLSALYRRAGQPDSAVALDARRLELWRHWERRLPNNPFVLRQIAAKPDA